MITADVDECSKSLDVYKAEVERKLKAMVAGFAREIAEAASDATVRGDPVKFFGKYQDREEALGIKPEAGFHKGAWRYEENGLVFDETIYPVGLMLTDVEHTAQAEYKVGDAFTIGAEGPAYEMLQTRDDILGTAQQTILSAYKSDLKRYYDLG